MMRRIWLIGVVLGIASLTGCNYFGHCVNGSGQVISEVREIEDFTGVVNTASFDLIVTQSDTYSVEVRAQENLLPIIETYISGNTLIIEIENGVCLKSNSNVEVHVSMPETELLGLTGSGRVFADVLMSTEVEVSNSGSGYMEIDSVLTETLDLGNSGSGHISILGSYVNKVDAVQSGSGAILCGTLFGVVEVDIRHSSSGQVSAIILDGVELDVVLSGSGRVELSGAVEVAEYSLNSSGRIDALDLEVSDVDAINTGSGTIFLWAIDLLNAIITGSGDIIYQGNPSITSTITGSGSLRSY